MKKFKSMIVTVLVVVMVCACAVITGAYTYGKITYSHGVNHNGGRHYIIGQIDSTRTEDAMRIDLYYSKNSLGRTGHVIKEEYALKSLKAQEDITGSTGYSICYYWVNDTTYYESGKWNYSY